MIFVIFRGLIGWGLKVDKRLNEGFEGNYLLLQKTFTAFSISM